MIAAAIKADILDNRHDLGQRKPCLKINGGERS
jgi:hypothetical protein